MSWEIESKAFKRVRIKEATSVTVSSDRCNRGKGGAGLVNGKKSIKASSFLKLQN
jgi:hypothetical protein